MVRKIISGALIGLGALFLVLSVVGTGAIWIYNGLLTREATGRLNEIDLELAQVQSTLQSSQKELERALRIVDTVEKALAKLAAQSTDAQDLLGNVQSTLDDKLLPVLETTRGRIDAARAALESLHAILEGISGFIPTVDLRGPDKILTDLIDSAGSLNSEIANAEELAKKASTFIGDTSYILGGDLTETRESLQNFLAATQEYERKVTVWRGQVAELTEDMPAWIDQASVLLTILLLWFGLSQFGLILHGLNLRRGGDPLAVLRAKGSV